MGLVLFYYTLVVLLISVLAAGACFSTYIVVRKRSFAYLCAAFLFYFFDVALVFQDDFIMRDALASMPSLYFVGAPAASIVTGCGILSSVWLFICDFFQERRPFALAAPGVAFVAGSIAALAFVPEGNLHQFLFYSMRGCVLFAMLVYVAARFVAAPQALRDRMRKGWGAYVFAWTLGIAVVAENVVFMFVVDDGLMRQGIVPFLPERNFAENLLMAGCALFVLRDCAARLSLHFKNPPCEGGRVGAFIEDGLAAYCERYGLTSREGEVLRLLLSGKDNQNIASEMNLAASTVKVHVHNILKKTGLKDRQEVMRDFRRRA